MKKVLSLICMALLAGGMIFTSCTKNFTVTVNSNNEAWGTVTGGGTYADGATATLTATPKAGYQFVQWNDGDKTNPREVVVKENLTFTATFEAITPGVKVTFNGTNWEAGSISGLFYEGTNSSGAPYSGWVVAAAQTDGSSYPECDVAMLSGKNTGSFSGTAGSNGGLSSDDFNYIEYYESRTLTDGTYNYGDWWAKSATVNVTAFDATALKVTANVNATMFDAYEALVDQMGIDAATTAPMTNAITSITLETSKGAVKMKGANKLAVK